MPCGAQPTRSRSGRRRRRSMLANAPVGAGAVLLIAALMLLLGAVVEFLTALGMHRYWAALIVGVVVAVVGGLLVMKASKDLKPSSLAPRRAMNQVRKDLLVVKAQVK